MHTYLDLTGTRYGYLSIEQVTRPTVPDTPADHAISGISLGMPPEIWWSMAGKLPEESREGGYVPFHWLVGGLRV